MTIRDSFVHVIPVVSVEPIGNNAPASGVRLTIDGTTYDVPFVNEPLIFTDRIEANFYDVLPFVVSHLRSVDSSVWHSQINEARRALDAATGSDLRESISATIDRLAANAAKDAELESIAAALAAVAPNLFSTPLPALIAGWFGVDEADMAKSLSLLDGVDVYLVSAKDADDYSTPSIYNYRLSRGSYHKDVTFHGGVMGVSDRAVRNAIYANPDRAGLFSPSEIELLKGIREKLSVPDAKVPSSRIDTSDAAKSELAGIIDRLCAGPEHHRP